MAYTKKKWRVPQGKIYSCPACGSHRIDKKFESGDFKYRCIQCYWHGENPIIKDRPCAKDTGAAWKTVQYEDIIKNLLNGKTILEQFEIFKVPTEMYNDGRVRAVRNKIMRVYNCHYEYTGGQCVDPELVKMKVADDVRNLVISAIEEEETKIHNAPRLSVTFGK